MNKLIEYFWLTAAVVIVTALALVAVPFLAFFVLVAVLLPVAISALAKGSRSRRAAGLHASSNTAHQHGAVVIETSYRRLDLNSCR